MKLPVAVQLFSLRNEAAEDLRGTLAKVKEMGYDGVELAGLYEREPEEIRAMCEAAGLTVKRLSRISIGKLKLDGLPVGKWRYLEKDELEELISISNKLK